MSTLKQILDQGRGDLPITTEAGIKGHVLVFFSNGAYLMPLSHLATTLLSGINADFAVKNAADADIIRVDVSAAEGDGLIITALPAANPLIAGALWNDEGVVKVSSGE